MGRFSVQMIVANNQDVQMAARGVLDPALIRRETVNGVVDCGAAMLVLPQAVVERLGLPPAGETTVCYADKKRTTKRSVAQEARVRIFDRESTFRAVVEPQREDALIGAIVMEDLDLLVDCKSRKLRPRDPNSTIYEIE